MRCISVPFHWEIFPMKEAHKKAIEAATEAGAIINFDPNLRFALWEHVTVYYSSIE